MEHTNNDLARTLGRMEATLEKFDEALTRFDHKLFGNGQPGELSGIKEDIGGIGERVDALENLKAYGKGALATIGTLVSALGVTEIYHLFFGRGK